MIIEFSTVMNFSTNECFLRLEVSCDIDYLFCDGLKPSFPLIICTQVLEEEIIHDKGNFLNAMNDIMNCAMAKINKDIIFSIKEEPLDQISINDIAEVNHVYNKNRERRWINISVTIEENNVGVYQVWKNGIILPRASKNEYIMKTVQGMILFLIERNRIAPGKIDVLED